jgi:hypothetical protein
MGNVTINETIPAIIAFLRRHHITITMRVHYSAARPPTRASQLPLRRPPMIITNACDSGALGDDSQRTTAYQ